MNKFTYLYYFHHQDLDIVEIKKDLPEDAPKSDIYKWLVIPLDSARIWPLRFQGQSQGGNREFRTFAEGDLNFDDKTAVFSLMGREFNFVRKDLNDIPNEVKERVQTYLSA